MFTPYDAPIKFTSVATLEGGARFASGLAERIEAAIERTETDADGVVTVVHRCTDLQRAPLAAALAEARRIESVCTERASKLRDLETQEQAALATERTAEAAVKAAQLALHAAPAAQYLKAKDAVSVAQRVHRDASAARHAVQTVAAEIGDPTRPLREADAHAKRTARSIVFHMDQHRDDVACKSAAIIGSDLVGLGVALAYEAVALVEYAAELVRRKETVADRPRAMKMIRDTFDSRTSAVVRAAAAAQKAAPVARIGRAVDDAPELDGAA